MTQKNKYSTKWNLSQLFFNPLKEIPNLSEKVEIEAKKFIGKWKNRNDYLENPSILKEALDEYNEFLTLYGSFSKEFYYYHLQQELNDANSEIKAKFNTVLAKAKQLENELQFFSHSIAKNIPTDKQPIFLNEPSLMPYKHYIEMLFADAQYLLTEQEEKIMNLKSKTSYSNWLMLTASLLSKEERTVINSEGKKEKKSLEEIISLVDNEKKEIRDTAAKEFNVILKKYIDVGEAELNSILENKAIDDGLRNVQRPDKLRHLADDIDSEVVDQLVETVSSQNAISQRFYTLKAKLLKLPILEYHERNIEYGELNKKYTYDEAVHLVKKTFAKLDPEFEQIFQSFVENGCIDVYPQKGKRSGAFCTHSLITLPTYILLNHTDSLTDVLTLAHESGHGINNELIKKKQNAINFGTPTSTAEVASTFMEDFVLQELMNDANETLQLSLMMMKLNSDISSVFRQIAAYKFEQELHHEFRKIGYLSKKMIGSLFQKYMAGYMGTSVKQSPGSENWWLYWTHIRYFFYNYSYASGLLISKSLQSSVKQNPRFITKVKEFLSAGKSESMYSIFIKLGIDIKDKQFWQKGLKEIEDLLEQTEELAVQLKKI